jgi:branched-chain amino acid transport system ATP-binding protein
VYHGIAHVPERRHIFPSLTTEENLLVSYLGKKKAALHSLLEKVYTLFPDLKSKSKQLAGSLSGGQQQMVAIGRAVMADPGLILLDEPTLGLAPILVNQVVKAVREIARNGCSILVVEEKPSLALQMADRGYVIEAGKIVNAADQQQLMSLLEKEELLTLNHV